MYNLQELNPYSSDIYSLGVVLFVMLTGLPLYHKPSFTDPWFSLVYSHFLKQQTTDRTQGLKKWLKAYRLTNTLTDTCVDLLSRLLCPEHMRASLNDIEKHEWLRDTHTDRETERDQTESKEHTHMSVSVSCATESRTTKTTHAQTDKTHTDMDTRSDSDIVVVSE